MKTLRKGDEFKRVKDSTVADGVMKTSGNINKSRHILTTGVY